MLYIESSSVKSGNISFTNDYIVIQGKYYNLRDWYIKKHANNISIRTQDILEIDFIKMRSKKILMIFIVFVFILVTFGGRVANKSELMFVMLIVCCLLAFIVYFFRTYRFIRITSAGCIVALETKYYYRSQLEYLVLCWNYLRYENNLY